MSHFSYIVKYKAIKLPSGDTAYVYYSKGAALNFSGMFEEAVNAYDML